MPTMQFTHICNTRRLPPPTTHASNDMPGVAREGFEELNHGTERVTCDDMSKTCGASEGVDVREFHGEVKGSQLRAQPVRNCLPRARREVHNCFTVGVSKSRRDRMHLHGKGEDRRAHDFKCDHRLR
eukprot:9037853-Pyramimonas_sp.AAC.1